MTAQRVVAEVGCEQFFGVSGFILSPRHSRLGVLTYECVAMLASIIQSDYIDKMTGWHSKILSDAKSEAGRR